MKSETFIRTAAEHTYLWTADSEDEDDIFMPSTKAKSTAPSKGKSSAASSKGKSVASTEGKRTATSTTLHWTAYPPPCEGGFIGREEKMAGKNDCGMAGNGWRETDGGK